MPKFMVKGRYTPEGVKGLRKDKASGFELGLGHQVAANKVCRAVKSSTSRCELRFCLIERRLGAQNPAMGGTEVEIVEHR